MWRKQYCLTFGLTILVEDGSYDNINVNYTFFNFSLNCGSQDFSLHPHPPLLVY